MSPENQLMNLDLISSSLRSASLSDLSSRINEFSKTQFSRLPCNWGKLKVNDILRIKPSVKMAAYLVNFNYTIRFLFSKTSPDFDHFNFITSSFDHIQ